PVTLTVSDGHFFLGSFGSAYAWPPHKGAVMLGSNSLTIPTRELLCNENKPRRQDFIAGLACIVGVNPLQGRMPYSTWYAATQSETGLDCNGMDEHCNPCRLGPY